MEKLFFIIIFIFFGLSAFQQNSIWKDEYTLWRDAALKSPRVVRPHVIFGTALLVRGALGRAEKEFLRAQEISRYDYRANIGLGAIYFKRGLLEEAVKEFQTIITELKPDFAPAHNNLGVVYIEKGLLDDAVNEFKITIKLAPYHPDAYANLGLAYKKMGMLKEARDELEMALRLHPEHRNARINLDEVIKLLQEKSSSGVPGTEVYGHPAIKQD